MTSILPRKALLIIIPLIMFLMLSSCDCHEKAKPDLLIPEWVTPDLVQKYFNPFDQSGNSYRNEWYCSASYGDALLYG